MLIHPTVERLRALGLTAMADAFIELQNAPDAGELSRESAVLNTRSKAITAAPCAFSFSIARV